MSVVNRKIFNVQRIACPKYGFGQEIDAAKCKDCPWYGGTDDKAETVQCLYDSGLFMYNMHVTEFKYRDYIYRVMNVSDIPDDEYERMAIEKIGEERYRKNDFDTCELCCFSQMLKNGETICMLRHSAPSEEISAFCCEDDEIWKQYRINFI